MFALHMYVTAFNPCMSNPCQNFGRCTNGKKTFNCKCLGNFGGTACERMYCLMSLSIYIYTLLFFDMYTSKYCCMIIGYYNLTDSLFSRIKMLSNVLLTFLYYTFLENNVDVSVTRRTSLTAITYLFT